VRQLILSPRWIMWHLLTIGAVVTCGLLAAWQWQRAGSSMGSALNVGYGLQWPVFAVFFGVMWWRMLSMEIRTIRGEVPDAPEDDEPVVDGPSPFIPTPAAAPSVHDDDDPELAAYNRMLAALAARDRAT
jgi:DNA-binding transcriptional regulator of glucitol operon